MVDTDSVTPVVQRWWLAAGMALVFLIIWGSLTPSLPDIQMPMPQFDKFEHISAYLVLTAWFSAAFPRRRWWIAIGFALFGGLIEILQGYTGRDPDWFDWFADCIGAGFGAWYPARWALRMRLFIADRHARDRA